MYEPLRNMGQRVADWFAPRSDASALEDFYEINVELPGVKTEDVDVSIEDNSLVVRGEIRYDRVRSRGTNQFYKGMGSRDVRSQVVVGAQVYYKF